MANEPRKRPARPAVDDAHGVFGISVAAELVGMGVQTLRLYEARGLVEPHRTAGQTRRYSANDLERLRRIGELLEEGLNLAGVGRVLALEEQLADAHAELSGVRTQLRGARTRLRGAREAED